MNITASDRKALIRLASSLPKGSEERKTILAGLKTGGRFSFNILAKHYQNVEKAMEGMRKYLSKQGDWSDQRVFLSELQDVERSLETWWVEAGMSFQSSTGAELL